MWPVILGGIFVAFCLAYYIDQKRKARKEKMQEKRREKFEQLLDQLKQAGMNNEK